MVGLEPHHPSALRFEHHFFKSPVKDENKILAREITPEAAYFNRRNFIRAGVLAASAVATAAVYRKLNPVGTSTVATVQTAKIEGIVTNAAADSPVALTNESTVAAAPANSGFHVNEPQTSL